MRLRHSVLGVVNERLKGAGDAGHLDEIADGPPSGRLEQGLYDREGEEAEDDAEKSRGPRRGQGAVVVAEEVDGCLEGLGAMLDVCA